MCNAVLPVSSQRQQDGFHSLPGTESVALTDPADALPLLLPLSLRPCLEQSVLTGDSLVLWESRSLKCSLSCKGSFLGANKGFGEIAA